MRFRLNQTENHLVIISLIDYLLPKIIHTSNIPNSNYIKKI